MVVFSASNKIWNLQHVTANKTKGAIGYVLKETPESALKAHDSFLLYKDFRKAVKTCFRLSDLKKIVEKQTELKNRYKEAISLDEFVNLVLLDKGANNNSLIKIVFAQFDDFFGRISQRKIYVNNGREDKYNTIV